MNKTFDKFLQSLSLYILFHLPCHGLYKNKTPTLAHSFSLCQNATEVWSTIEVISISCHWVFLILNFPPQVCSWLWSKYSDGIDLIWHTPHPHPHSCRVEMGLVAKTKSSHDTGGKLEVKSCAKTKEAFFLKQIKKDIKTNKLKWKE